MSGSPKYTSVTLQAQRQAELEAERRRQAEAEALRRREAEARERVRRIEAGRRSALIELDTQLAAWQADAVAPQEDRRLRAGLEAARAALRDAGSDTELAAALDRVRSLGAEWRQAEARKRREEEERRRTEALERLGFEVEEAGRTLAALGEAESRKHDGPGRAAVDAAAAAARQAVAARDVAAARAAAGALGAAIERHCRQVAAGRAELERRRAQAEHALGTLDEALAGLAGDPIVQRWKSTELAGLRAERTALGSRLALEDFEGVSAAATAMGPRAQALVEAAGEAQLRADRRDCVAAAMRNALQSLGFFVDGPRAEHEGHPGSALVLSAQSAAGRYIGVSVPVDGEVWYEVEGYAKASHAGADGAPVATCDDAEAELTRMHGILREQYGVEPGEVRWEGKDPNRVLVGRDELPTSGPAEERRRTR